MTAIVPTVAMNSKEPTPESDMNITIRGKFKSVDLFNRTLHIILYPDDGLRAAVRLQEIEEGTDVVLDLKTDEGF